MALTKIPNLKFDIIEEYRKIESDEAKLRANEPILRRSSSRRKFGQDVVDTILARTQSGIDKEGRQFTRYSAQYAKQKGVGRGEVDLTDTGRMLNSMSVKTNSGDGSRIVEIFVDNTDRSRIANVHHTGDGLPRRDFWGLPNREIREIINGVLRESS